MLRQVFAEIRRSMAREKKAEPDPPLRRAAEANEASAALVELLRAPLPHPRQFNYETLAWLAAGMKSAEYMVAHMMAARNLLERMALLDYALEQCSLDGLVLEFGVYTGASLRAIARRTPQPVHGFDSFEGLPEDWSYFQKKGRFGLEGRTPHFSEPNIELHKGWFDATLPGFLAAHPGPIRFLHVDCDLYSSTKTVLALLAERLVEGSVIVFDEYLNYPGWEQHEFKAFQEFVGEAGRRYRYIGFASAETSVAVTLL